MQHKEKQCEGLKSSFGREQCEVLNPSLDEVLKPSLGTEQCEPLSSASFYKGSGWMTVSKSFISVTVASSISIRAAGLATNTGGQAQLLLRNRNKNPSHNFCSDLPDLADFLLSTV